MHVKVYMKYLIQYGYLLIFIIFEISLETPENH